MSHSSAYVWFLQALNVMNAALEVHRNSLRLRPLLSLAETKLDGHDLTVAIVDDERPSRSVDYVTIRLQHGRFVLVSHTRTTARIDWRVSKADLMDVARNPRRYLDDPDQFDFAWLHKRVGLPAPSQSAADAHLSVGTPDQ